MDRPAFLFGKAPAHGDFFARNLTPEAEQLWDGWASGELETARAALEADFETAHDAAPPWGFICGPGPLGEDWRAGAVAASIDSAGRRFLLVAGYAGLTGIEASFAGRTAVAACEAALRTIITDQLDADAALALLERDLPGGEDRTAAALLDATPGATGVWGSLAGLGEPLAAPSPPQGLVSGALAHTAELLKEAA